MLLSLTLTEDPWILSAFKLIFQLPISVKFQCVLFQFTGEVVAYWFMLSESIFLTSMCLIVLIIVTVFSGSAAQMLTLQGVKEFNLSNAFTTTPVDVFLATTPLPSDSLEFL